MTPTGVSLPDTLAGELAAFGPFFAINSHAWDAVMPAPWQPMSLLIADTGIMAARVEAVRTALADRAGTVPGHVDIRVAASVAHLGLVARLLAPMIGASTLGHPALSWSVDDLWWQNTLGGPYPLSATSQRDSRVDRTGVGAAVEAITAAITDRYQLSRHVVWGNVGSAANSAARLISVAQPDLSTAAHVAADAILADPRIDHGTLRAGSLFQRRSCCLIYRITNDRGASCGDCVLKRLPDRPRNRTGSYDSAIGPVQTDRHRVPRMLLRHGQKAPGD